MRRKPSRLAAWEVEVTGLSADTAGIRREEGTFVSPALHVQHYVIDPEDGKAYELLRIQGFTPESPAATHVFLQISRNYAIDDDRIGEFLRTMFHEWAERDAAVLDKIQCRLGEPGEPRCDINVKADRAAVRARRIAMEMVGASGIIGRKCCLGICEHQCVKLRSSLSRDRGDIRQRTWL